MKILFLTVLLAVAPASLWAGETKSKDQGGFDFDQPFDEAMANGALRSLLNRALDVIEDHVEMRGKLRRGAQTGEEEGRLELRIYPRGKSRSGHHVTAEGWFRFSPGPSNNEMTFGFRSSKDPVDRSDAPEIL
ncbi:MAG: hypothetical protein ABW047_03775 [Nitrospiraceae bacterium]